MRMSKILPQTFHSGSLGLYVISKVQTISMPILLSQAQSDLDERDPFQSKHHISVVTSSRAAVTSCSPLSHGVDDSSDSQVSIFVAARVHCLPRAICCRAPRQPHQPPQKVIKWRTCESTRGQLPHIGDGLSCRRVRSREQEDHRGWGLSTSSRWTVELSFS